jgi:hypothetical protein
VGLNPSFLCCDLHVKVVSLLLIKKEKRKEVASLFAMSVRLSPLRQFPSWPSTFFYFYFYYFFFFIYDRNSNLNSHTRIFEDPGD